MLLMISWVACVPQGGGLPFGSTSADCAACHPDHYEAWSASGHATSGSSPVFLALLPEVEAAWGTFARETCVGCHAPGHGGDEAIGCVSCHAAVGNHGERDGRLAVDLDAPLAGPLGDSATPTAAHNSTQRGLLTSDSLCGTCHEVTGPGLFVEETLTEHRASPAAADGQTCTTCHAAPTGEAPLTPDGLARPTTDHAYQAFSPPWEADDADAALASTTIGARLAAALSLGVETLPDGHREAVIRNESGGHTIPTGVSFLRSLHLTFEPASGDRRILLRLGAQPTRDGEDVALITDADAVRDDSLPPDGEARISLPDDAGTVSLRARAIRTEVLDALDLGGLEGEVPEYELTTITLGPSGG